MNYLIQPNQAGGWISNVLNDDGTETPFTDASVIRLGQQLINHGRRNGNRPPFHIFFRPDYDETDVIIHSEA